MNHVRVTGLSPRLLHMGDVNVGFRGDAQAFVVDPMVGSRWGGVLSESSSLT